MPSEICIISNMDWMRLKLGIKKLRNRFIVLEHFIMRL